MIKGVDISHHQGNVNFDLLRPASDFAILKATEGKNFVDNMMINYRDNARRVGMLVGYYHFARPTYGNTPEEEATFFLKKINGIAPGEIVVLDFEENYPQAVSWCKRWLDYVAQNLNGTKPLIYMDKSRLSGYDWTDVVAAGYGLWLASYDNKPEQAPASGKWSFAALKQFTSSGTYPGITGNVDGDTFFGSHDAWKKYGYYKPADNIPPTPPPSTDPCEQLKAENVQLKSTIESMKIQNSKDLAIKEEECQNMISAYKEKLRSAISDALKNT